MEWAALVASGGLQPRLLDEVAVAKSLKRYSFFVKVLITYIRTGCPAYSLERSQRPKELTCHVI